MYNESNIARWRDRFMAWLIDVIIISMAIGVVFGQVYDYVVIDKDDIGIYVISYIPTSIVFFAYWTILEWKTGQSIGKKALRLKITDKDGMQPGIAGIAVSSFGKAFLLPFDVILGWIFTNDNKQRILNMAGNTIVVKISKD